MKVKLTLDVHMYWKIARIFFLSNFVNDSTVYLCGEDLGSDWGIVGNRKFCFAHGKFEMLIRHVRSWAYITGSSGEQLRS